MAQKQVKLKEKEKQTEWTVGQKCEVYSRSQNKWISGEVIDIFTDQEGEWIKVKYGRNYKEVPPNTAEIRPLARNEAEADYKWTVGSQCEVYIREKGKWAEGEVINTFTDDDGYCIRVQYGERVRDLSPMNIAHDLRARGTSHLAVTLEDFKKLKSATERRSVIGNVLKRILANSEKFASEDGGQSLVSVPEHSTRIVTSNLIMYFWDLIRVAMLPFHDFVSARTSSCLMH